MKLPCRRRSSHCVVSKSCLSSVVKPLVVALVAAGIASPAFALDYFWNSGDYSSSGIPSTLGVLDRLFAQTFAGKSLDVAVFNAGTFAQKDGTVAFGSTFANNGTYDVQGDLALVGGAGSITNNGLLKKSAGTGAADIRVASLINNGVIDAQSGMIEYNTFTPTFNVGTVFAGGLHRLNLGGTFNADPVFSSNLEFAVGTFTAVPAAGVTLNSNLSWTRGELAGKWINAVGQTLTASSATQKSLSGAFVNAGTFAQKDGTVAFGSTFANNGTYDVQGDLTLVGGAGSITNNGLLKKSAGTGAADIRVDFANTSAGKVQVDTGTLTVTPAFTNQGVVNVVAGATFLGSNATFVNAGTLSGNGTIATHLNGDIVNLGAIDPGIGGIGTLTFDGDLKQSAPGHLNIELASLLSSDKLSVTDDVTLGGDLAVWSLGGYNPTVGDRFVVMTFDQRLGSTTFSTLTAHGFGSGVAFETIYNAHDVTLAVVAVPEPEGYAMLLAGLAMIGTVARRRGMAQV